MGGYVIERALGTGGSGEVYLVRTPDGTHAALKRVDAHDDPVAAERLRREVRALTAVRHPAVPRVLDAELDDEDTFVVFEYIEGASLVDEVMTRGPLAGEALAHCAERIAGALEAAHAAGVVHRDVTPSNVMMSPQGAVLIDFGLSHRAEDTRLTREGLVSGTAGYVAPEVIDGTEPGAVADRWSWAATVAFAMTGKAPFGVGNSAIRKTLQGKWRPPAVPGAEVLQAALERDVDARPGMRDVVAALRGATTVLAAPSPSDQELARTAVMETFDVDATAVIDVDTGVSEGLDTAVLEAGFVEADEGYGSGEGDDGYDVDRADADWLDDEYLESGDLVLPGRDSLEAAELARRRPVLVAFCAIAVAAGAALAPVVSAAVVVVAAIVARTVLRRSEALRVARVRRGMRRRDSVLHTVGLPWHVVRGTVELLPSLLVAAGVGVGSAALGWYLVSRTVVAPGTQTGQMWGHAAALVVGALVFQAALWWGLWSWSTREGTYRAAEVLAPTAGVVGAWIVVALMIVISVAVAVYVGAEPWWWPLPPLPQQQ